MLKLSIIILSFNTKSLTTACVNSIIKNYKNELAGKEIEIIVADNASLDGTMQALEKFDQIRVIKNKENYGFSKGNNLGSKDARGDYILFLNSDVEAKDNGFLKMIDFMDENPNVGILGAKLSNADMSSQQSCGNFYTFLNLIFTLFGADSIMRKSPSKIKKVDWVSGGSFMIRKSLFNKLKGFDESFFMYIEDMELCFRAKKIGFLTYFYPNVKLIHKELGSSSRGFAILNIYKGIIYFYKKHNKFLYPLVKVMLLIKAIVAILIGILTNNNYLKNTYSSALKIAI